MQKSYHHLQFPFARQPYFATIAVCILLNAAALRAQIPTIKYDIFSKPAMGGIMPKAPQSLIPGQGGASFEQMPNALNYPTTIARTNAQVMGAGYGANPTIADDVLDDIREFQTGMSEMEWLRMTNAYRVAYEKLMQMNPDSFSLSEAVFTVENAFFDSKMAVKNHAAELKRMADVVRQQLKREGLDPKDDMALNYGIQKLFQKQMPYYDKKLKRTITIKPYTYDFKDFRGEENYYNLFVTKMMVTKSGQCHSMPLLYLMLAEELNAKAWLSLAPQHSFVQFRDRNGNLLNFETTNGNLVSSNWLLQSGFINANALKEKTYMDTLSKRQLFAQCLSDLLLGYMHKFGYDSYADKIRRTITAINPKNLTVALIDANLKTQWALSAIKQAGMPKETDLSNHPVAYQAYLTMHQSYEQIDALGYQDMPEAAYQAWLKTIEKEKKKQENTELKERMQKELQFLKKPRSTVVDKTRG